MSLKSQIREKFGNSENIPTLKRTTRRIYNLRPVGKNARENTLQANDSQRLFGSGKLKALSPTKFPIMSACFCCSLIRSYPLSHDNLISRPLAKLSRPIFSLALRKQYSDATAPRFVVVRAVQPGLGVVEPGDVSVGDPPSIDVVEAGNGKVLGVVGGVADAKLEDDKPLAPATRVRKKKEEEGGDDNRFKLRNGREVGRTPFCFFTVLF